MKAAQISSHDRWGSGLSVIVSLSSVSNRAAEDHVEGLGGQSCLHLSFPAPINRQGAGEDFGDAN